MNLVKVVFISSLALILGIIVFAVGHEWIIIRYPQWNITTADSAIQKKTVTLLYWHENNWTTETQSLLWSAHPEDNTRALVNAWLSTLTQEQYAPKKVSLDHVLLSASHTDLYISFDRNPFSKQWNSYTKLMWLEGLLKTIRENNLPILNVLFLINNKPFNDPHINCAQPWPITGFILHT